ncbi:MAG TPA: gluconate 2-dehydrogenase subunit 3 family protein [Solirubrobacteraceae bacterium]|nr:gluconate 2-dehydrogenase subunit 3 family protein [Solirubrobacteraceae bacterium]
MADVRSPSRAGHLPKQGGDTSPGPPRDLPRQRKGTTPQLRVRYPDYDVLAETEHWDAHTRRVVLDRVANVPEITFFDESEARTLRAFCDVVAGQDHDPRVPVLEMVDAKMAARQLDGFRHHDMPPDPETWRQVAAALDRSAEQAGCDEGFAAAGSELQHEIVQRFSEGELDWDLPVEKAWGVVMRGVLSAFYSHPWAWNEIGFGGPAYPRGYARLGAGQREHWEAPPEFSTDPVHDVPDRGLE